MTLLYTVLYFYMYFIILLVVLIYYLFAAYNRTDAIYKSLSNREKWREKLNRKINTNFIAVCELASLSLIHVNQDMITLLKLERTLPKRNLCYNYTVQPL